MSGFSLSSRRPVLVRSRAAQLNHVALNVGRH